MPLAGCEEYVKKAPLAYILGNSSASFNMIDIRNLHRNLPRLRKSPMSELHSLAIWLYWQRVEIQVSECKLCSAYK